MKVLLVVNPSASSVTARTRIVIQKALSADHRLEVAATTRRGHATRLAQSAANDGIDVVVVLGGDGTLNEAANGLAGSETALAAVPGGSTNVFARTLGLPDDPVEATGALLDAIEAGSLRRVGLGCVNDRYFLFHAGVGFDAAVVEQVERKGGLLKRFAGHPLFVAAAIDTWARHYDRSSPAFRVSSRSVHEAPGDDGDDLGEAAEVEGLLLAHPEIAQVAVVGVPDERLERLAAMSRSAKVVPASVQFTDIGGLVEGAASGEGLGNRFLAGIREVDAIVFVLRAFRDGDVPGPTDPLDHLRIVEVELALADLETVERQLDRQRRAAKGDRSLVGGIAALEAAHPGFGSRILDEAGALRALAGSLTAQDDETDGCHGDRAPRGRAT